MISDKNSKEVSLKQEAKTLTNDKGETIVVTYFAEGIDLAMTLKRMMKKNTKWWQKEPIQKANLFYRRFYAWELSDDGNSGRLTDKQRKCKCFQINSFITLFKKILKLIAI